MSKKKLSIGKLTILVKIDGYRMCPHKISCSLLLQLTQAQYECKTNNTIPSQTYIVSYNSSCDKVQLNRTK